MQGDTREKWQPLTREEIVDRVWWVSVILLASAAMVVAGFLLGVLVATWLA
jgi:hypothetical protein